MSSFDYLKTAIKQKRLYAATQVAGSQRNDQRLRSQLHRYQNQSQARRAGSSAPFFLVGISCVGKRASALVFGKVLSLHTGHIYLIQRACSGG